VTKEIIEKGDILSNDDISFVANNITAIQKNWEKRQVWRTETEMRISVLNDIKFPTAASKYWQSVREQSVFYENLVTLSFDYRRNAIDIKKVLKSIAAETDELERDLLQVDLEEMQFRQINMEQAAKDRMREIRLWSKIMLELDDGTFDTEDANTHQLVSYGLRFENQLRNLGSASPSEKANLVGQYETAVRHLDAAGIKRP